MRQAEFENRYGADWTRFQEWLEQRDRLKVGRRTRAKARAGGPPPVPVMPEREVPALYRRICAHLALAQDRQYSPLLIDRINALVLRGHHALYGSHGDSLRQLRDFFRVGFPAVVRRRWKSVWLAILLFFGPLIGMTFAVQQWPDLASLLIEPAQLAQMEAMYAPENHKIGMRDSDSNFAMFGHYIWNNVRIGFQTFATGIVFGLGTLFFLLFNGFYIGAIAGHLTETGHGLQFWSFVSGHAAMELTAIAISGAAGFQLALALVAPGRRSRARALVENGHEAMQLMAGAGVMFFVAALIEAFWSPNNFPVPWPKYAFGIVQWIIVIAYFLFSGRRHGT